MNWIAIDSNLCTGCETCVTICPRDCFSMTDDIAEARADDTNCNLCGHCVAICPTGAVLHNQMNMPEFTELNDLTEEDLFAKFRHNASRILTRNKVENTIEICMKLDEVSDINELTSLITL